MNSLAMPPPPTQGRPIPGPPETLTVELTVAQLRAVRATVKHYHSILSQIVVTSGATAETGPKVDDLAAALVALERAGGESDGN